MLGRATFEVHDLFIKKRYSGVIHGYVQFFYKAN